MATVNFHGAKEGQLSPLFPFGPMVLYAKLPMNLVRRLNKYGNKIVKNEKKSKKLIFSLIPTVLRININFENF